MKYFINFSSYLAAYHGLQMQEKAIIVQSKMVDALHFKASVKEILTGCGRTDAGVYT
jgi:tRNA U38,U39,U40 pseudouridine synthase TruA